MLVLDVLVDVVDELVLPLELGLVEEVLALVLVVREMTMTYWK